ncbi:MAG TPA: MFS transporter [Pseudolabrys sp.]|nr:MFS transporter [Pseudolabrys sp.]
MASLTHTAHAAVEAAEERAADAVGGKRRLKIVLLLAAILALDTADKATVAAVAPGLKQVFHIGNTDIGVLVACVSFMGAALSLPMGSLIDRVSRKTVLVATIALWTLAMVVSGTATSFIYLLLTRVALGGVTASASPAVASLTGDFFPARDRSRIYGFILAGELVGTGIGFVICGEISALIDWRWAFYFMAVPSAALAWVIWRYLPEPERGRQSDLGLGGRATEQAQRSMRRAGIEPRRELVLDENPHRRSVWWIVRYLLRIPTYRLLVIASALGYYFFAGVRGFAMIYLTQHYSVSRATISGLGIVIGIGAIAGLLAGGWLAQWMLDRGWTQARILVPGVSLFLAALFYAPGIWTTSLALGLTLLTVGTAALAAANPPIDAARLDIVPPQMWGRGEAGRMALRGFLEGGAPILFGAVSEWFGGGQQGLEFTYLLMLIPVLAASALAIPAYMAYPRDVATASASVQRLKKKKD